MKKIIFTTLIIVLTQVSCQNEDNITPPVIMKNKLKDERSLGHYYTVFEYNDLGYISSKKQIWGDITMTFDYTYDKDRIIHFRYHDGYGFVSNTDYFYMGNVIVEKKTKSNNGNTEHRVLYKYDEDENLVRSTGYVNDKLFEELYLENENGNIVKSRSIRYNEDGSVYQDYIHKRGYDDKFHPTAMSYPESFRKINQEGKNNNLNPNSQGHVTCTYNSENYPVKIDYGYQVYTYSYHK